MVPELGILEEVDPRRIWSNEARDFTPWLKENIGQLAQVLGTCKWYCVITRLITAGKANQLSKSRVLAQS
ncbi:MAG: hypothetical protein VR67_11765 [Peptococcaceae bacterium BRH_c8a]|nr:MAG: hypothetical protein VR67_11765 [Peptococcaceae bacterium BRH_c8a]